MYDVVIVGAGPGGIFTAYELLEKRPDLSIAVFEMGNELTKRHCPMVNIISPMILVGRYTSILVKNLHWN